MIKHHMLFFKTICFVKDNKHEHSDDQFINQERFYNNIDDVFKEKVEGFSNKLIHKLVFIPKNILDFLYLHLLKIIILILIILLINRIQSQKNQYFFTQSNIAYKIQSNFIFFILIDIFYLLSSDFLLFIFISMLLIIYSSFKYFKKIKNKNFKYFIEKTKDNELLTISLALFIIFYQKSIIYGTLFLFAFYNFLFKIKEAKKMILEQFNINISTNSILVGFLLMYIVLNLILSSIIIGLFKVFFIVVILVVAIFIYTNNINLKNINNFNGVGQMIKEEFSKVSS